MYVVSGGYNLHRWHGPQYRQSTEFLEETGSSWTKIENSLPEPRVFFRLVTWDNVVYALGSYHFF